MWRAHTQLLAELSPAPPSSIFLIVRFFLNELPRALPSLICFSFTLHQAESCCWSSQSKAGEPSTTLQEPLRAQLQ